MEDKTAIKFIGGITGSFILVKILKNILKEPRPILGKTYGMPSSRSTIMAFIVVFLLLNYKFKVETKYIIIILGLISIYLKYYLKEHSIKQLIAGLILGIIIAYIITKCF